MKYKGNSVGAPPKVIHTVHREPENIVFVCEAVLDYSEFEKLVPSPQPPLVRPTGKAPYYDTKDKKYLKALDERSSLRTKWMLLKTIQNSEVEFETIRMDDPTTWDNFENELSTCLTPYEVSQLLGKIYQANIPNERVREEAENFSQVSNMLQQAAESLETPEPGTT